MATTSCHAGRIDARQADATGRLPAENFTADQLKQAFQQQGLSVQEFVALAGAHTVMPCHTIFTTAYRLASATPGM